jgi:hypothetical protein
MGIGNPYSLWMDETTTIDTLSGMPSSAAH